MREIVLLLLASSLLSTSTTAKSTIEPCSSNDTCNSLLGYTLYTDLKVSEVASLFQTDPISLLLANAIDISYPDVENHILPSNLFLKIPLTCSCLDGIRKSLSTRYKTRPSDTLASIAGSVYGGLVSAEQIQEANSVADPSLLDVGTSLVVPLPCACFNGSDDSLPAVYLSYVVRGVDTLAGIARRYETTVSDLMNVNAMGAPDVSSGDILAVPLSACASNFPKYASDFGLIVPNGSYALAAGHCVQCSCALGSRSLYCEPASLAVSCSSMQCRNSNLMLGNITVQQSSAGCNVTTCDYNGFANGTILTMLSNSLQPRCPGPQRFAPLLAPPDTVPKDLMYAPAPSPDYDGPGFIAASPGSFVIPPGGGSLPGNPANGPAGSISTATFSSLSYFFITCLISISFVFSC
ncbi:LysM domain-containing GPI-anchored protein 1 [Raphanus sativus]|uniref:LysM domain-containing GPI-anchored protein 1-like n=2 Tax=Raphanus sativus TaxID=3726 RepID=A0A6J0KKD9_RAPSA|nr:lysM domain-containing GPI-anchored protein 1-like [Raphanus sativus]KAJ4872160.1 LysM domain-containing GPI-anchored protein 1 [Raphanus sativus]